MEKLVFAVKAAHHHKNQRFVKQGIAVNGRASRFAGQRATRRVSKQLVNEPKKRNQKRLFKTLLGQPRVRYAQKEPPICRVVSTSGIHKWYPQVVSTSGIHKWYPQVVSTSGIHKWYPQVVSTSGIHKWYPQVVSTSLKACCVARTASRSPVCSLLGAGLNYVHPSTKSLKTRAAEQKRVALYARVSTDEQNKGLYPGCESQIEELERHCHSKGWKVIAPIIDPGYTAGTLKRPGLTELRGLVREEKIDLVLCTWYDRFTRSREFFMLDEEFKKHNVGF